MNRSWAEERSLERAGLLAGSDVTHQVLRRAVVAEIGRMLPFDAFVWPLCDPLTTVGMAPRARIPCPRELPRLIRLKYLSGPGRWTALMNSPSPVVTLLKATHGEPSRSPVWDGVLKHYGVRDVVSVVFADKYGCWAWLDLWRTGDFGPFTDQEAAYLGEITEAVTAGIRRSVSRQFRDGMGPDPLHPTNGKHADLPEQAVLTLDEDLAVAGQTASVADWLQLLQPGPSPHHQVPAEVLNVAAQLLAREAGVDAHEAGSRVHIGAGRWASLRANRMDSGGHGSAPLAVTIQGCTTSDRLDMFARAFGLTPRQRELVWLASAGTDTETMAETQGVTQYTVQDQFKKIFQGCGVHSRPTLLALALGTGTGFGPKGTGSGA
ncbi:DNA-binding CsgD family transcriptional regulator [Arthrobacter sp. B1I2]|nr:DNA-binding CsgD family transcriptional regulator [Arthrobacter sp. B1I2]